MHDGRLLYGAAQIIAALLIAIIGGRRLLAAGYPRAQALRALVLVAWGAIIGAFAGRAVVELALGTDPVRLLTAGPGRTVLGSIAGGLAVAWLCCRHWRWSIGDFLDRLIVPVPLAHAVGRLGCLAAGCCAGRETDSWLGVSLPDVSGTWTVRYPTQAMAGLAHVLIFAAVVIADRYRRRGSKVVFPGFVALVYLCLHFLQRVLLNPLRAKDGRELGVLPWGQTMAAIGLTFSAVAMAIAWSRWRTSSREPDEDPQP